MSKQDDDTPRETTGTGRAWRSARREGTDRYEQSRAAAARTGAEPTRDVDMPVTEPGSDRATPVDEQLERRSGAERRMEELQVEQERRIAERRVAKQEAIERRNYAVARATQAVDYVFYLLYGLLGIRFALTLLGASEGAGFVSFIYGLTQPFYAPFSGIVSRPPVNGGVLDFPLLIALLAYALLHLAVRGLLRLTVGERSRP